MIAPLRAINDSSNRQIVEPIKCAPFSNGPISRLLRLTVTISAIVYIIHI